MNKLKLPIMAGLLLAGSLTACAPMTHGYEPLALNPDLARESHIGWVRMSSDWLRVNDQFGDTFTEAVRANLDACARGPRTLDLNIHVDQVVRGDRNAALARGHGEHQIAAVAELVEPKTKAIVGRYPIHLVVDAGSPAEILLADRQLKVSDAFGRELCRQAFGG